MANYFIVFLSSFLLCYQSHAASCCGGGANFPALITGDYRAQFSVSATNQAVAYDMDADNEVVARDGNQQEVIETYSMSASYLVSPLWQLGLALPYKVYSKKMGNQQEITKGVGDFAIHGAYEFIPEYGYSAWRPRGFIFLKQSFPFARSIHESRAIYGTDALGSGLYTTSLGVIFVKSYAEFDLLAQGALEQSHTQKFHQNNDRYTITSSPNNSLLIGAGYSPAMGDLRLGSSLTFYERGPMKLSGDRTDKIASAAYRELGLDISYLLEDYSISGSYRDQAIIAGARNTNLSRSLSLSFIYFISL